MVEPCWQRLDDWIGAEFDDGLVMLDADSGKYFGLNKSATAIWLALDRPMTAQALTEHLRTRFAVSEERCAMAVARILERLAEIGAVKAVPTL